MELNTYYWIGFFIFVFFMLAMDLWVFNKKAHEITVKEALIWSAVWISLAMVFNVIVYLGMGSEKALQFLAGYIIEKSLSVDNLFVFIMVFSYFNVKKIYQHKVLFWWILWAIVMRGIFIYAGIKMIENFNWIIYVFWVFLIITSIKMIFESKEEVALEEKMVVKLLKKIIPISKHTHDGNFFTVENGKKMATPLFVALIMIEFTDLIFAVDSIPAILAISNNMFIVYTSNIFAILGMRSLYFALSGMMWSFVYLKYGLAWVLSFVGFKMLISGYYHFPIVLSLGIIITLLWLSVLASYIFPPKKTP